MRYQNLIWDFDGTLFDSYPHICAAYLQALQDFDRTADAGILMDKLRINFRAAHDWLQTPEHVRERFTQYEHDISFAPCAVLYDGMKTLLEDTHARGCRHFLFTHRGNLALTYMENIDILPLFTDCITADSVEHFAWKPAPDAVLYFLDAYHLIPAETVMIGDREVDIGSGVSAGIDGLLFDEFHHLQPTAAKHRVYSIAEMHNYLIQEKE